MYVFYRVVEIVLNLNFSEWYYIFGIINVVDDCMRGKEIYELIL